MKIAEITVGQIRWETFEIALEALKKIELIQLN